MYRSQEEVAFQLTVGGRVRFDFEKGRAFIWFVDAPSDNRRPLRPRRIDVWVKERVANKKDIPGWLGAVAALAIPLFVWIAWWAQNRQWSMEKEQNLKIAPGWF
jgi:hypothetical protein